MVKINAHLPTPAGIDPYRHPSQTVRSPVSLFYRPARPVGGGAGLSISETTARLLQAGGWHQQDRTKVMLENEPVLI
jgi:hypothetical protein